MATKRYDVVAVTGTYIDRTGVERKRYMNCGAVFETEKGLALKLEAIPVNFEGWFQLYEPRENQAVWQGGKSQPEQRPGGQPPHAGQPTAGGRSDVFEDDIPF